MTGALMQLVAYGTQDVYLTGKPTVTFFRAVYKRHTNFAMETIIQNVDGNAQNNQRISTIIARNGDLLGAMHVQLKPTAGLYKSSNNYAADCCWIAERAFSAVTFSVGGQIVDKHYQTWWRLYAELFLTGDKKTNYNKMTSFAGNYSDSGFVMLPLLFFFNRNPGLYLPLIALQYHEVKIEFDCSSQFNTYFESAPTVWANYVFLDKEERKMFAEQTHEYLIEQVQFTGDEAMTSSTNMTKLSFSHPVKELVWCYQTTDFPNSTNGLWNFTSNVANINMTVNSKLLYNTAACYNPNDIGQPFMVLGTNSNVYTGDGEYGNNFPGGSTSYTAVSNAAALATTIADPTSTSNIWLSSPLSFTPSANMVVSFNSTYGGFNANTPYYVLATGTGTSNIALSSTPGGASKPISTGPASAVNLSIYPTINNFAVHTNLLTTIPGPATISVGNVLLFPSWSAYSSLYTNLGLSAGTYYYVTAKNGNVITLSPTSGGPSVTLKTNDSTSVLAFSAFSPTSTFSADQRPVTNSWVEEGTAGNNIEVGPLQRFNLILNGQPRFTEQYGKYFNQVQPFYHHTGNPYPGIYSYSFALKPEEHQPTGTCNFSRIDYAQVASYLKSGIQNVKLKMFAVNYNIFKVSSGLGGLSFSN